MDPAAIAAGVVSVLAPFLKGFMSGVRDESEKAGEAVGGKLREVAAGIWRRLHPKLEETPAALQAAEKVADQPDDQDWQAALRVQLKMLLEEDRTLAQELGSSLEEAQKAGVIADVVIHGDVKADRGGVAAGRDITGGVNTGGGQPES
jgi:ATP/maltotriose-dependent transcriptional regulator MalT